MSDKDIQKESNVTDFPNADTVKKTDQDQPQQTEPSDAVAAEQNASKERDNTEADRDLKRIMEEFRIRAEIEADIEEKTRHKRAEELRRTMFTFGAILAALMLLIFVSSINPSIYTIDRDTLFIVNQALNAIILLSIPFLLGMVGASARIMIATVKPELKGNLLISSGLMATFSWVGIKSGVLIAIIVPHLERASM